MLIACVVALLANETAAAGVEGYVLEAVRATPGQGSPLAQETILQIEPDGHMVVMALSGRTVRKDGPYIGRAAEVLSSAGGGASSGSGNSLPVDMLESLLELSEVSETSKGMIAAVRLPGVPEPIDSALPDAISSATRTFCLEGGAMPDFYAVRSPAQDEPLIFRRLLNSRRFLLTTWPAGAGRVPWPKKWGPPREGRYVWTLGNRAPATLRIRIVESLPEDPLMRAALFLDMRCTAQALAVFRAALAGAERF
ncbi:MAG: hypothetical protein V3U93_00870 [Alphaproteobacteria bacterium]